MKIFIATSAILSVLSFFAYYYGLPRLVKKVLANTYFTEKGENEGEAL
jgi:hypothetical protein